MNAKTALGESRKRMNPTANQSNREGLPFAALSPAPHLGR